MENFLKTLHNSSKLEIAEYISTVDGKILHSIFETYNIKAINKIISTGITKANGKIFNTINTALLLDALTKAQDDCRWSFIKNITIAQRNELSKFAATLPDDKILHLIESAPSRELRLAILRRFPIGMKKRWMEHINQIEMEIDYLKSKSINASENLAEEKTRMIAELSDAISAKKKLLEEHERELRIRKDILEDHLNIAQEKLAQTMQKNAAQEEHLRQREAEIAKMQATLDEAEKLQVQLRIETKVPEYVTAAVSSLEIKENIYRKKAKLWAIYGSLVLLAAIAAATLISLYGTGIFNEEKLSDLKWQTLVFVSFKGLIVLGVLGLWAKHAFAVSNAYMHEAIKRSDRAHAINFGKLYLEIYGNSVDRKELIDIFENWNITSESAFSKVNTDFEPRIIEKLGEILKSIQPNGSKQNQS